jgi:hypothetical protein
MPGENLGSPQQLPMEAIKTGTAALLSAGEAMSQPVSPRNAFIVGSSQPDLFDSEHSPYGAPVRLIVTAGGFGQIYQTIDVEGNGDLEADSFAVVDLKDVESKEIGDSKVRFVGGVRIEDEEATHLLVGRTFGDPGSTHDGFIALHPGKAFEIGRNNPEMGRSFGITPKTKSTVSGKHGRIRVMSDGSIALVDFGSTNGTGVITRNNVEESAVPDELPLIEAAPVPMEVQASRSARVRGAGAAVGRALRRVVPEPPGEIRSNGMGGTYRKLR